MTSPEVQRKSRIALMQLATTLLLQSILFWLIWPLVAVAVFSLPAMTYLECLGAMLLCRWLTYQHHESSLDWHNTL